jgi:diaminopimelate epimerase
LEQDGVNVDLLRDVGGEWRIRTYERGVEGETLCCGSALLAAGWCLVAWGLAEPPLTLVPAGGDRMRVGVNVPKETWFLEGPARIVYRGEVSWPLEKGTEEGEG